MDGRDGWVYGGRGMDGWVGGGMGRCEGPTSVNKSDLHRECCWFHIHLHLPCPVLALPLTGPQWPLAQPDALPLPALLVHPNLRAHGAPSLPPWAGAELVSPLSWVGPLLTTSGLQPTLELLRGSWAPGSDLSFE